MSAAPTIVINGPPEAELTVAGLGPVTVRVGDHRLDRAMRVSSRRPLAANYRGFANTLLASVVSPEAGPADIDTLPEASRRKLMLAVVRLREEEGSWVALYGSSLSFEERFFAVMLWSYEDTLTRVARRMRELRRRQLDQASRAGEVARRTTARAARVARPPAPVLDVARTAAMLDPTRDIRRMLGIGQSNKYVITSLADSLLRGKASESWVSDHRTFTPGTTFASAMSKGTRGVWPFGAREPFDVTASARREQFGGVLGKTYYDPLGSVAFRVTSIDALLPDFRPPTFRPVMPDVFEPMRRFTAELAEFAAFWEGWEGHPLQFLMNEFALRAARRLMGLTQPETEEVLLAALEEAVTDGDFVTALREVLRDAPYVSDDQRTLLDHGLEHAAAGQWLLAANCLLPGLEGALWETAVANAHVVDRGGRFIAAEGILDALAEKAAVTAEYWAFTKRLVFCTQGNAIRHGRRNSYQRARTLHGLVALAGWVDDVMGLNAMGVLASLLDARLDAAIAGVVEPELLTAGA